MTTTQPTELPHLLTVAELVEQLGVDIRHIRRLVAECRIPFIKWGHLLRFDPAEIDTYRHHPGRPRSEPVRSLRPGDLRARHPGSD